jgi:hypothetical protein
MRNLIRKMRAAMALVFTLALLPANGDQFFLKIEGMIGSVDSDLSEIDGSMRIQDYEYSFDIPESGAARVTEFAVAMPIDIATYVLLFEKAKTRVPFRDDEFEIIGTRLNETGVDEVFISIKVAGGIRALYQEGTTGDQPFLFLIIEPFSLEILTHENGNVATWSNGPTP